MQFRDQTGETKTVPDSKGLQPYGKPRSVSAPRKFGTTDAPALLARFLAARFQYAPNGTDAEDLWMVEAVRQLSAYFVTEVEEAATALIAHSKVWPPFADIRERADKIRANTAGQAGGLKAWRDRSPDKTPEQVQRAIEHCAKLRQQFPDAPWPEKKQATTETHWADKPIEIRPLTAEEVESLLRVTNKTEAA